jgi:Mg-chelatase subunit ChlD
MYFVRSLQALALLVFLSSIPTYSPHAEEEAAPVLDEATHVKPDAHSPEVVVVPTAKQQEPKVIAEPKAQDEAPVERQGVDAVILVDTSGSMLETDPDRLRDEGIKHFINLLVPDVDRVAIVPFSDLGTVAMTLTTVNNETKDKAQGIVSAIKNDGFYTNFLSALQRASFVFQSSKGEGRRKVVVLITDGKFEPPEKEIPKAPLGAPAPPTLEEKLFAETLPLLREDRIGLYTLGIGPKADSVMLERMSKVTDGSSYSASSPDEITPALDAMLSDINKPMVSASEETAGRDFKIDPNIHEATFYVSRRKEDSTIVVDPRGRKYTKEDSSLILKWFHGDEFDVATFTQPEPGDWKVAGLDPDHGFVALLTNLRLVAEYPPQVVSGQGVKVTARLFEGEKPVILSQVSDVTDFYAEALPTDRISQPVAKESLNDNGVTGDLAAKDGVFSGIVTVEDPGEYRLKVVSRTPTFERIQLIPFRVKPRPVTITTMLREDAEASGIDVVGAIEELNPRKEGEVLVGELPIPDKIFLLELSPEAAQWKKPQLKLLATDDLKRKYSLPYVRVKGATPRFVASPYSFSKIGKYELTAVLTGESRGKFAEKGDSKTVPFTMDRLPDMPEIVIVEKDTSEEHAKMLSILSMILSPIASALAAVGFKKRIISIKGGDSPKTIIPIITRDITNKVAELEALVLVTEVDFANPLFIPDAETTSAVAAQANAAGEADGEPLDEATEVAPEEGGEQ